MERCKCGRPVRRVIVGEPERLDFTKYYNEESFCVFRKSQYHQDGKCNYCASGKNEELLIGKMGRILYTDLVDHLEDVKHNLAMSIGRAL